MARLSIYVTALLGLAVFFFDGGIHYAHYASAAMNHGGGSLSDYCRSHCAPTATPSARNACEFRVPATQGKRQVVVGMRYGRCRRVSKRWAAMTE